MSRFLRASAGVILALLMLAIARLLRRPRPAMVVAGRSRAAGARGAGPGGVDAWRPAGAARRRRRCCGTTRARRRCMYGVHGHTWVALGEPIGTVADAEPLVGAVPRTLRRLQRPAGRLPGVEGLAARLHRLRTDVRDAGRGRARLPAALRDGEQRPSRAAHDDGAPEPAGRDDARRDAARRRAADAEAAGRLGGVARRARRRRTGLCDEPLRRALRVVAAGGRRRRAARPSTRSRRCGRCPGGTRWSSTWCGSGRAPRAASSTA